MFDAGIDPTSPVPRYYQIYHALREAIMAGEFEPGQALPAERQLAEGCKVARLTVVKALDLLERDGLIDRQHGRGTFVLEPYSSDAALAGTLALICSPTSDNDLLMGMSRVAFEHRYHLQVLGIDHRFRHLDSYLETCIAAGVQGFLVFGRPGTKDAAIYQALVARGIPVVMVDRYYPQVEVDHVVFDNEQASFALTERLLARGHERIAVVPGWDLETTAVRDRLRGYCRALNGAGLAHDEDLIWLELYDQMKPFGIATEGDQQLLREKLERHQPSAILTINDIISDRLLRDLLAIQSSLNPVKLVVQGADIVLATFSNYSKADHHHVAVHPAGKLGEVAAKLLIDRLRGRVTGPAKHVVVPMQIVDLPIRARRGAGAPERRAKAKEA